MNLKKFAIEVSKLEGGKKNVSLAQIEEILKCSNIIESAMSTNDKIEFYKAREKQYKRFIKKDKK